MTPPAPPYTAMPECPAVDEPELTVVMAAAAKLPRGGEQVGIVNVVRGAVRAALAFERTGDVEYLISHAEILLKCLRMRTRPDWVEYPPDTGPCDPSLALDVEDVLVRHGM